MATTITAGNATNGAAVSSDNTGILELKTGTGAGTTALTLSTAQAATFAGAVSVTGNATLPTIRSNAVSTPPTIQDSAGTQIGTFCRAWVNFNGTTVTNPASMTGVRASFNIASILDNGTGDYTVNFTTAMPNINYSVNANCSHTGVYAGITACINSTTSGGNLSQAPTTTTTRLVLTQPNVGYVDSPYVCVSVFSS
jgi:hypothetical protein